MPAGGMPGWCARCGKRRTEHVNREPGTDAHFGYCPEDNAAIERARVELCRLVPDCAAHPQEAWGIAAAMLRAARGD